MADAHAAEDAARLSGGSDAARELAGGDQRGGDSVSLTAVDRPPLEHNRRRAVAWSQPGRSVTALDRDWDRVARARRAAEKAGGEASVRFLVSDVRTAARLEQLLRRGPACALVRADAYETLAAALGDLSTTPGTVGRLRVVLVSGNAGGCERGG